MKINLKDFPDKVYIQLKKEYKDTLFKKLSKIKLKELENKLQVTKTTIIEWKKRARYIPLGKIRKIFLIADKKAFLHIEKNIISYKTKKSRYEVKDPIFPIIDSPELREIVLHIMCDGCFSSGYAAYYNINEQTKKEFVSELYKSFGEVGFKTDHDHVHFPSVIPTILKDYLKIDFNSKKCRIPKEFFKGNRKELTSIIRAVIIDEGTIDGSNIRLDSCNKEFLEDIKNICKKLDYSCGKTWESKGPIFRFNILAKSIQKIKKDMEMLPIEKKQLLIDIIEKNQKRGWKYKLPGEVKIEILRKLLMKPMKTIELIVKIGMGKSILNKHLKWLIEKELVTYEVKNNIRTYLIKDGEKARKFIRNPSKFIKGNKIENYGVSQLKILKTLEKNDKKYSEMEKLMGFCKSTFFKLISRLIKKELIKKVNKKYTLTNKGKRILLLKKDKARYLLYANIK